MNQKDILKTEIYSIINDNVDDSILNSFKIKNNLNKEFWQDNTLKSEVRNNLLKIAIDFFKSLNLDVKLKDVIFTGSLANFNWSEYSDIDLHLILDFDEINGDPSFIEEFFWSQKTLWNETHNIEMFDYPIEIYIQNIHDKLTDNGIYSIKNNKWIVKPIKKEFILNKKNLTKETNKFLTKLDNIEKLYTNKKYNSVIKYSDILLKKIYNMRKTGLNVYGAFSLGNLLFKILRRTSFIEQLNNYKNISYDNMMTIKENYHEIIKENSEFINNIEFKTIKDNNYNEFTIEAIYEDEIIGKIILDVIYDVHSYFEDELTNDEIDKFFPEDTFFIIEWLEVPDDYYKNAGVGRALMNHAINKAKNLNQKTLYLNASPIGTSGLPLNVLVKWYESFGFTPIKKYDKDVLMVLKLK